MRLHKTVLAIAATAIATTVLLAIDNGEAPAGEAITPHTVGLVDTSQGSWYLYDQAGTLAQSFFYGNPGDYPIFGDWDCDGTETPGMYRQSDGYVYLRNSNTQGPADTRFFFGNPGDVPIAGDFNGDGCGTVSIYRPSNQTFYIINELGAGNGGLGAADVAYVFGNPGDKPFVGDFNGDGIETVGLHRESTGFVYFRNSHSQGPADNDFFFGDPGDRFTAGDWNGDGTYSPSLFRPANETFYQRYTNTQGNADNQFVPAPSDKDWWPIAGVIGGSAVGPPSSSTSSTTSTSSSSSSSTTTTVTFPPPSSTTTSTSSTSTTSTTLVPPSETEPPVLVDFDFSPTEIDVGSRDQRVVVQIIVTDETGTRPPEIVFESAVDPTNRASRIATLIYGTPRNGIWEAIVTIPQGSPSGVWNAILFPLTDELGNTSSFGPPNGFPSELTVLPVTQGSVQGFITDTETGAPLAGIKVEIGYIYIREFIPVYGGTTGSSGYYFFPNLDPGNWVVKAFDEATGRYFAQQQNVSVVAGTTTTRDFQLQRRFVSCSDQASVPVAECEALATIYLETDGSTWFNRSGWLYSNNPCTWYGVSCSAGSVVGLDLGGNNLVGSIPQAVSSLPRLQTLDLGTNRLSGAVPITLQSLSDLVNLTLNGQSNCLTANSSAFGDWLGSLDPTWNDGCSFTTCSNQWAIPQTECAALIAFHDSTNGQSWEPGTGWAEKGNPCTWSGVGCVGGSVWSLGLSPDGMSGPIPPEIQDLPQLRSIVLGASEIEGPLPEELGSLSELETLYLRYTHLSGDIPPALGNLSKLRILNLGEPRGTGSLTGSIPPELGGLANLEELRLERHSLTGTLPTQIGSLSRLKRLALSYNSLSGILSDVVANLVNLTHLEVQGNDFTGALPSNLGDLADLQVFDSSFNSLSGALPSTVADLTQLTVFKAVANSFDGPIPTGFANAPNLTVLDFYNNDLSGSLPASFGSLLNLSELTLSFNSLSGEIPTELGNMSSLRYLKLDRNAFGGEVPSSLQALPLLQLSLRGQADCLTASTPAFADWLASYDVQWNDGCTP